MINQEEKARQLHEFEDSLKGKSLVELKDLEEEIVKEADAIDKEVTTKEFDLPEENYKIVAKAIKKILEKKTVQWQFTLGMVAMCDFWDEEKKPEKVAYPMLDGTLRALGECTFTGYDEWAAVVAINKYFEDIREEYINTTEKVYDIAAKHNAIMDAIQKNTPIGKAVDVPTTDIKVTEDSK